MSIQEMYATSSPIPLRAHKKSSNGCRACKERKVKCDEKKPICRKCSVHFSNIRSCDWEPTQKLKRRNVKHPDITINSQCHQSLSCDSDSSSLESSSHGSIEIITPPGLPVDHFKDIAKRRSCPPGNCGCPCHEPKYTAMLLDAVLGVCRICGNHPASSLHPSHCIPVMPDYILDAGRLDPFSVLPEHSSPRVHALIHHWVATLSLFPTEIHSQYCTNPRWMSQAIASPVLFHSTLYVSAIHEAGLRGNKQNAESVYYKAQTIKALNEALRDPSKALDDETLAAVLLIIHIVSIVGEQTEAETHMKGLKKMINLRGGICNFTMEGVFLHMLCTTNHLTAVLVESQSLHHPSSPYYIPPSTTTPAPKTTTINEHHKAEIDLSIFKSPPTLTYTEKARQSPLLRSFAITCGFHKTVVDIFDEMGYLYFVVDAFTNSLLLMMRPAFEGLMVSIEQMIMLEEGREEVWREQMVGGVTEVVF